MEISVEQGRVAETKAAERIKTKLRKLSKKKKREFLNYLGRLALTDLP